VLAPAIGTVPVSRAAQQELGLPRATRTGNAVPFAIPDERFDRARTWWFRRGIGIERSKPGAVDPQDVLADFESRRLLIFINAIAWQHRSIQCTEEMS